MANFLRNVINDRPKATPGHVLALLAVGRGEDATAVVTDLAVTTLEKGARQSLTVVGSVRFAEASIRHYEDTVLSLVHSLGQHLAIPSPAFEACVTNLSAASAQDRSALVSGYSIDAALYVACLSAMLNAPLLPDVAVTGHIASMYGDVRMVRSLPAKLRAAATAPMVETVLFPDPAADNSLGALTPEDKSGVEEAIRKGRDRFRMTPVRTLEDLIRGAFAEPELLLASLRRGYFGHAASQSVSPPGLAVLAADLPIRFWACVENALNERNQKTLHDLLQERMAYQRNEKAYPTGFGRELYGLLSCMPPGLRHSYLRFPLLPSHEAITLVQLASPDTLPDLRLFLDAVAGDRFTQSASTKDDTLRICEGTAANKHLAVLLEAISPETLYRKVGHAIEAARASFVLESITAKDDQECLGIVTAFHAHVLRHCGIVVHHEHSDSLAADALELLERTFSRQGGLNAAYSEARSGTQGRLRYVLDAMTEQFRMEEEDKLRNHALKEMLTNLGYEERVALIKSFKEYVAPQLSEDALSSPPERLVKHAEVLLRAYAQSSVRFKQLVRSF